MFWQKLAPLYIIAGASTISNFFFIFVALLNLFFGRVGALGQTQLRPLFAYSSISHMGWIILIMFFSKVGFFYYFLLYGFIVVPTINLFKVMKVYSFKDMRIVPELRFLGSILLVIMIVIAVAGMPPFTGFFMKVYGVYLIIYSGYFGLSLVFCLFASIRLSYYIHIVFIISLVCVLNNKNFSSKSFYHLNGYN